MALRNELRIPVPDPVRIEKIAGLAHEIIVALENGSEWQKLLRQFASTTGRSYDKEFFETLYSWTSEEDFAIEAALPVAPFVPDLARHELIDLVDLSNYEENYPVCSYYRELFDRNVPMSLGEVWEVLLSENSPIDSEKSEFKPTPSEIVDRATDSGNIIRL